MAFFLYVSVVQIMLVLVQGRDPVEIRDVLSPGFVLLVQCFKSCKIR